jgi:hypothetical protein
MVTWKVQANSSQMGKASVSSISLLLAVDFPSTQFHGVIPPSPDMRALQGLDPASRHNLWDVVKQAKRDRGIILTTHSMEEATVLCDRLGIFVDGRLVCIGNPKELTARYGGYYVSGVTCTLFATISGAAITSHDFVVGHGPPDVYLRWFNSGLDVGCSLLSGDPAGKAEVHLRVARNNLGIRGKLIRRAENVSPTRGDG